MKLTIHLIHNSVTDGGDNKKNYYGSIERSYFFILKKS